jgi:uncharacterized surface protein with fasciclin (FAS1) repeats
MVFFTAAIFPLRQKQAHQHQNLLPATLLKLPPASGSFPTLLAAVEAAGLADALSDESASLTVFAPTEEAFAALPEGTLDALLADPEALAGILTYHVLGSEVRRQRGA